MQREHRPTWLNDAALEAASYEREAIARLIARRIEGRAPRSIAAGSVGAEMNAQVRNELKLLLADILVGAHHEGK